MQLSQVLTLAFAATALGKVYNDNTPIPASVERLSTGKTVEATDLGPAVGAVSAKLRAKALLQARAFAIYMCEHSNFGGSCITINGINSGVCYNLNGIWNDVVSSTDTYGHTCTVFQHQGCTGDQSTVNGAVNWGYMNDKISSYRCY
ncbi:hypothetical protein QBC35DRAFT_540533 [Podospora australis]|uniref:Uncharacterized protein n=1 Tax=Podospora australis TaxID=1536484 RepID=A0AAN6WLN7_9PEZI|nr:hypothetical protein QBC35DRAFT_540533 [Podospora australis]